MSDPPLHGSGPGAPAALPAAPRGDPAAAGELASIHLGATSPATPPAGMLALPPGPWAAATPALRRALVIGLTVYGVICLSDPGTFRIPDALNLAIHETGHLLFLPFGEFMHFLGGTIFQLAFPLLFVLHFARRGDRFAACVVCWWVAQSFWNVSVYVADARAQLLPLVGGGEHDWAYILGTLGLLEQDQRIARSFHVAGTLTFIGAMWMAWSHRGENS